MLCFVVNNFDFLYYTDKKSNMTKINICEHVEQDNTKCDKEHNYIRKTDFKLVCKKHIKNNSKVVNEEKQVEKHIKKIDFCKSSTCKCNYYLF